MVRPANAQPSTMVRIVKHILLLQLTNQNLVALKTRLFIESISLPPVLLSRLSLFYPHLFPAIKPERGHLVDSNSLERQVNYLFEMIFYNWLFDEIHNASVFYPHLGG